MADVTYMGITPNDVVLSEATPKLQRLAWELNGIAWAKPIEVQDYVARETYLSQQELTRDGRCRYWILHHKHDPTHIVASCESTRKTVLVAGGGRGFREEQGYAVASVYTNPKYRRLGMAGFMLRKLQEHMDRDSACSVLYSDIGKVYYSQLGWAVFPSEQATLHLLAGDQFVSAQPEATRYLAKQELQPLCERDVAAMKAKFQALVGDAKTHVAFAPTFAQIAWQLAREEFMARVLWKKEVERRGAVTADGKSWICWDHDWREKKLKVMRVVTSDPPSPEQKLLDIVALLSAALAEASQWGLQKVVVWNPDGDMTRGIKGVGNFHEDQVKIIFDERADTSIPSFRWRGGESVEGTVWEDNEYYCWC
ncbi:GNAT family [Pleurostoma richardsiae]|uniref:GNAT family n=1 Tax=Pleurostoma richardsiae TaxID=41990 RepID=A0AA38RR77_9PEZI|nr:GNAT family [Pleurostoma richardsiae]